MSEKTAVGHNRFGEGGRINAHSRFVFPGSCQYGIPPECIGVHTAFAAGIKYSDYQNIAFGPEYVGLEEIISPVPPSKRLSNFYAVDPRDIVIINLVQCDIEIFGTKSSRQIKLFPEPY